MRALILVMSARRSPWGELMDASRETWDSVEHEQTQTLYYCGASNGSHPVGRHIFYSALSENLDDLSARTIEAYEHALTIPGWDFIARPNSSCYVHKINLVKYLETLPATGVLRGLLTDGGPGVSFLWGGGQYILSRDVVEMLVAHKDGWHKGLQEDEAVSRLAEAVGIALAGGGLACSINSRHDGTYLCLCYGTGENFVFSDFADMRKAEGHFFFRVKQDHDRTQDIRIMRELQRHFP